MAEVSKDVRNYSLALLQTIATSTNNITTLNIINLTISEPANSFESNPFNIQSSSIRGLRYNDHNNKLSTESEKLFSNALMSIHISYIIKVNIYGIKFSDIINPLNESIINQYFNTELHKYALVYNAFGLLFSFSGPLEAIQLYPVTSDDSIHTIESNDSSNVMLYVIISVSISVPLLLACGYILYRYKYMSNSDEVTQNDIDMLNQDNPIRKSNEVNRISFASNSSTETIYAENIYKQNKRNYSGKNPHAFDKRLNKEEEYTYDFENPARFKFIRRSSMEEDKQRISRISDEFIPENNNFITNENIRRKSRNKNNLWESVIYM